ncbi:MAG TPA: regulatory protein RecX [Pyrinomonadaceae bacterium]|nr:regulatory protein RecX [Pyrinomonadaceae bacterium]
MKRRSPTEPANPGEANIPEEIRRRTFQRAIKLLAAKPRSIADLRESLLKGRGARPSVVEDVIARLREYGYLDDERFAFGYAALRVKQKPIGRLRLKRDLMVKKVDQEVAEEALDLVFGETSEEELIDRAIEKRVRLRGRPQTPDAARKLFDHLMRQGFPFELVSDKMRALAKLDSEEPAESLDYS